MTAARALGALLLVAAAVAGHRAWGQVTQVAPSPAQRCLTRGTVLLGTPEYPPAAYEARQGAQVEVDMAFAGADEAPQVRRIRVKAAERFDGDFERSVRTFVRTYRVPCLSGGETAAMTQEFVFVPHDGRPVSLFATHDPTAARRAKLVQCMRHLNPGTLPQFPTQELRAERQGNVVLRVSFDGAESAPKVETLDDAGSSWLARSAAAFAGNYRLPCHDGDGPVAFTQFYYFRIEGASRVVLRDLSLLTLVRSFKGIERANVYFDFNEMGCPFDIRFGPRQPTLPNDVGEIGGALEQRRFFLDWLSRQQLDLPPKELNALVGQAAVVAIPCTILNLGARTGGGASQ